MSKAKRTEKLRTVGKSLDAIDRRILAALDEDARRTVADIAKLVVLSPPSVRERIRGLEQSNVIRGFTIAVDTAALGYAITAVTRIRPLPGKLHLVERLIQETLPIVECDRVMGDDPFVARIVATSIADLDGVLKLFIDHATTSTTIVKGTSVRRRLPPDL